MNKFTTLLVCALLPVLLAACAVTSQPIVSVPGVAYRCDQGEGFDVTFGNDAAVLTGPRGRQELLRDAGGLTPQQAVYGNAAMRAEFGLGSDGRQAVLRTVKPVAVLRCVRN